MDSLRLYGKEQRDEYSHRGPSKTLCERRELFLHLDSVELQATDSEKGVPHDTADKLRKMFAYLDNMEDPDELRTLATWKAHTLTGDRKGTWSLSVTRNGRLTFRIDTAEREIREVDLED